MPTADWIWMVVLLPAAPLALIVPWLENDPTTTSVVAVLTEMQKENQEAESDDDAAR